MALTTEVTITRREILRLTGSITSLVVERCCVTVKEDQPKWVLVAVRLVAGQAHRACVGKTSLIRSGDFDSCRSSSGVP